jgi:hypothetical protein
LDRQDSEIGQAGFRNWTGKVRMRLGRKRCGEGGCLESEAGKGGGLGEAEWVGWRLYWGDGWKRKLVILAAPSGVAGRFSAELTE